MALEADTITYTEEEGMLYASGNTVLKFGDFSIRGDKCKISRATGKGLIEGNVRLQLEQADISAKSMEFTLDKGLGTLTEANGILGKTLTFTADKIQRTDTDRFVIEKGSITSCPADNREWEFRAKHMRVRMEGLAVFENVSLRFYDYPVFYFPYWFAPAVTKRTTGFLFPALGFSSSAGAFIKNSLFWAKSNEDDATLYLDWMDKRGWREGVEYRYAFAERTNGQLNVDHLEDRRLGERLYSVKYDHQQQFSDWADSMARLDIESRTSYSKEFDTSNFIRTRRYTDSFANVHLNGSTTALSLTARGQKEIESQYPQTFARQPELALAVLPHRMESLPLAFWGSGSATSFYTSDNRGTVVSRADLRPTIATPFAAGRYLNLTPWVGGIATWYSRNTLDPKPLTVAYYSAGLNVEGPRLYRVFEGKTDAIKHTFTPRLDYTYLPGYEIGGADRSRAMQFDILDKSDPKSLLSLSLLNNMFSRARGSQILRLNISQGYDFNEASRIGGAPRRPLADLVVDLKSQPWQPLTFNAGLTYNHYDGQPTSMSQELGATIGEFHLSYDRRYSKLPLEIFSSALASWRPAKSLRIEASTIYDEVNHVSAGSLLTVNWESCCWGISFSAGTTNRSQVLTDGSVRKETETKFYIGINLKGIGDVGEKAMPLLSRKENPF